MERLEMDILTRFVLAKRFGLSLWLASSSSCRISLFLSLFLSLVLSQETKYHLAPVKV